MAEERVQRRLAAILAADMVGYSRLMGADEEGTIARQKTHRAELIDPEVASHGGRIVKTMGDGLLVEFPSVVEAVRCAVAVQEGMAEREADVPDDRRIRYRVGINLGDIVIDGDDILGDGVNVAARLEGLAEPGGICISDVVHQSVEGKLDLSFADMGAQQVKNIAKPVHAYRVTLDGAPAAPSTAPLPLPDKPSIAVLPFENLSGDAKQDHLGDGIADNIITALSRIADMFVIARTSTLAYKGKPVKVQQVAEELGVHYVLEGSVQASGDRVRVTAQLIDAMTGHHLWAERYEREVEDAFALQDDITLNVVTALEVELTEGDRARIMRGNTKNPEAYQLVRRGERIIRRFTKEENAEARRLFQKAVEVDPNYAHGWNYVGFTHQLSAKWGWDEDPAQEEARAEELAHKALAIDPSGPGPYNLLANISVHRRRYDEAIEYGEKAVALAPNDAVTVAQMGRTLVLAGRPEEGLPVIERGIRLSPFTPSNILIWEGEAYHAMGRYEEAIAAFERACARDPESPAPLALLALIYADMDRMEQARAAAQEVLKLNPSFSATAFVNGALDYKDRAKSKRNLATLRQLGLPE